MERPLLDDTDRAILRALQGDGRLTNLELSRRIGLSPAATHARVRALERGGAIRGYTAIVDRELAGFDLLCLIGVQMQAHQYESVGRLREAIRALPQVLECHHVTGEYDLQLKVALRNRRELEQFVVEQLTPMPGVARIHTSLVLNEVKSTTTLPLDEPTIAGGPLGGPGAADERTAR